MHGRFDKVQSYGVVTSPRARRLGAALLGLLMMSSAAFAHHSFAMFDMGKQTEFTGTVKSFLWTNPHSLLVVTVTDAGGKVADYFVEMNGPGYLVRKGWKRDSVKSGDKITVTVHPLRDGSPGGDLVKVVFPDGRELSAQIAPPPGLRLPGAGDSGPPADKK